MKRNEFIEKKGYIDFNGYDAVPIDLEDLNKRIYHEYYAFVAKKVTLCDIIERIDDLRGYGTVDVWIKKEKVEGTKVGYNGIIKTLKHNLNPSKAYVVLDDIGRFPNNIPGSTTTYVPSDELKKRLRSTHLCIDFSESFGYYSSWCLWELN